MLYEIISSIEKVNKEIEIKSQKKWLDVAKPLFSLGKLEHIITQMAAIRGDENFSFSKKALVIMCADNGVVDEGVTQTDREVTASVAESFLKGITSSCVMSKVAGVDVFPVDVAIARDVKGLTDNKLKIAYGTENITKGQAMTRENCIKAIELGIKKVGELKQKGYDIIATGEMGIGNTTTSSAMTVAYFGCKAEEVTGRGAGLSKEGHIKKIEAVRKAVEINKPDKNDPIDVISKVGGYDIAAMTGLFLGGAYYKVPVVIDGFISGVSALSAVKLCNNAIDYILPSHISKEPAVRLILDSLNMSPIIDANMCLGEGTGAVALMPLLDMAYKIYNSSYTFKTWGRDEAYEVFE